MPDNTKVNLNISDYHQPASMQMNRRFHLISRDKDFSNPFSVHFPINDSTSCCTANVVYGEVLS